MNTYEFTFLLGDEKEVKSMQTTLKAVEGKVVSEKAWGEKELSYPIGKANKAFYYTWIIQLDSAKVTDFKQKINFGEKCLRYLLINSEQE